MNQYDRMVAIALLAIATAIAGPATAKSRPLEFGPYVGHYGFDRSTHFEDFALFGARLGVRLRPWLVAEGGFDEVYTSRAITDNRARQVSISFRARVEPFDWVVRPFALVGGAVVFLDDSEDPDAWGDALDLGAGVARRLGSHWILRAEWVLRRQGMQLLDVDPSNGQLVESAQTLWGRALTMGVSREF